MSAPTAPRSRRLRLLAALLWLVYIGGSVGSIPLRVAAHEQVVDSLLVPLTAFATVGWLVADRRPRNPLGWLFLAVGAFAGVGGLTESVVTYAVDRGLACHGIVMFAAWIQLWFWYPLVFIATAYTMLLFPNGLPSRRWRPVLVTLSVGLAFITVAAALGPTVDYGKRKLPNPLAVGTTDADIEHTVWFRALTVVMVACMFAAVLSLAVRFRRSRGIERAQLKWFLLGAFVLVVSVAASALSPAINKSAANDIVFAIALSCLPLGCGLAVLRYRLYDVDRIVSRAVSYVVVTGLVLGGYVGLVALIESAAGFSSSIAVAASTLAAAAAFQPLRRRVQRRVDHRFDRAAYDARRTVERFSTSLRDEVNVDAIRDDLLTTVAFAVAPVSASVWVAP